MKTQGRLRIEGHVMMGTETGVMPVSPRGLAPETRRGAWNRAPLRASRKSPPPNTLISNFWPPKL